jgi:hypothetical protein
MQGADAAGLRGVGPYESTDFNGMNVSMAGGGYLNIAGQDAAFDGGAIHNSIHFTTKSLSS